jgi:membrane protein YqaA with SNARE-associated domain
LDCSIVNISPETLEICITFLEFSKNNFLQEYGAIGLFFNALLAATVLPLPTEILVSTLLNGGESEIIIICALVAGGGLGGIVNYGVGFGGSGVFRKLKPKKEPKIQKDHKTLCKLKKLGWVGIFLSAWVPIFGDLMLMSAGARKMNFRKYVIIMVSGKTVRSIIVVFSLGVVF